MQYALKCRGKGEVKVNVPREVPMLVRWYHIIIISGSLPMCVLYFCVVCGTLDS